MAIIRKGMKANRPPRVRSEVDIAGAVVTWLRDRGWTVYQEVQMGHMGRRIDIVAELDRRLWAIECKRVHSWEVIEQAMYWIGVAHWVSVATAGRMRRTIPQQRFHQMLGVGWLHVDFYGIEEVVPATLHRRLNAFCHLRDYLCEGQQTVGTAGSQSDYYTNFRSTREQVTKLVAKNPGLTMKEIVDRGEGYHYASSSTARASLAKWIGKGVIPGIEAVREGKTVRYYPIQAPAANDRSPL
jgi:hypothetical protein